LVLFWTFYLLGGLLDGGGSVLDGSNHVVGVLLVNSATNSGAGSEDLQNSSSEGLSEGAGTHDLGNTDDIIEGDVSVVLDVLLLLTISVGLVQSLDDQSSGGGDHLDLGLTVLDDKLD
jgi:hypothetical protein